MQGYTGLNRAVDGDIVAVELLPEEQWSAPSEIVLQDDENNDEGIQIDTLKKDILQDQIIKIEFYV